MPNVKTLLPETQEETKRIRVAAYCRVSTESDDQKDSFSAQVEYYTNLIDANPAWELVDIYADEGISGVSMTRRDEFNRMLRDCRQGKIDRVITKSVSRFARNTIDCLSSVRMLSELGVSVLFEKEKIDTAKMSGEMLLALSGTQAQDESISISGNVRWSYERRMRNGDFVGNVAPFGYRLVNGTLVVNEPEAEIVRKIFDMYLSGVSKVRIAIWLNENRPVRQWQNGTVDYILNNERYIGDALLQKKYTTETFPYTKKRNKGEKSMYYVSNNHPPIIPREQYEAVQSLQKIRYRKKRRQRYELSKLLICGECGHPFHRVDGFNKAFWQCSRLSSGFSDCKRYTVREEDVCDAVLRMMSILHSSYGAIIKPAVQALEDLQSRLNGTRHKVFEIDKAIADTSVQIHLLTQLQSQGILEAADFASQSQELSNKISRLRGERMKLLRQNEHDERLAQLRDTAQIIEYFDETQVDFDYSIIREVVEKIIIHSDTDIEIHLFGGLVFNEHLPSVKRKAVST